jgi:metal-responsive CopG/Arc/MetJ family transcriptional regulator
MKTKGEEPGTTGVSVRLPNDMLASIDRLANDERRTRGNAIRLLLEEALQVRSEATPKAQEQSTRSGSLK